MDLKFSVKTTDLFLRFQGVAIIHTASVFQPASRLGGPYPVKISYLRRMYLYVQSHVWSG